MNPEASNVFIFPSVSRYSTTTLVDLGILITESGTLKHPSSSTSSPSLSFKTGLIIFKKSPFSRSTTARLLLIPIWFAASPAASAIFATFTISSRVLMTLSEMLLTFFVLIFRVESGKVLTISTFFFIVQSIILDVDLHI